MQQCVFDAVRVAVEDTQKQVAIAPGEIEKRQGLAVGRATGTDGLAKLGASSSHTAIWGAQPGTSGNRPISGHVMQNESPSRVLHSTPKAHDPRDHLGYDD